MIDDIKRRIDELELAYRRAYAEFSAATEKTAAAVRDGIDLDSMAYAAMKRQIDEKRNDLNDARTAYEEALDASWFD
jgi:hypothetical protein